MAEETTHGSNGKPKEISSKLSVSFPERKEFELHTAAFGDSIDKEIEEWLHESIRVYKEAYDVRFKQMVPRWREIADGKPKEKSKSFPWPNCSNLVVQVVGQGCDDLSARVMGLVWATAPIANVRYYFKTDSPERDEKKKVILEQFLDNVAYEPDELDMYRKECVWFADSAKLGTAFIKLYPEKRVEVNVVGYDEKSKRTKLETSEMYNGPSVDNLDFEHVLCDPQAPTWEQSRLKVHIRPLSRHDLDERAFSGFYDKEKVDDIRTKPDRHGPEMNKQRQQSKKGINPPQTEILAEWDMYECNFWWYVTVRSTEGKPQKVKVDLLWSYHYSSRTVMRQVFNFMPWNACSIIPTKLSIGDKGPYGRGYAEMLENSQEEVSTIHNQRIDARTMGITGWIRSSNTNIDKNITVYPFAIIPAAEGELEWMQGREPGDGGVADEELTLRLANERAGVGPAVAGMGAGGPNKKGQYGSMGTLAVMQDGNSRTNHRTSDFRHSHVKAMTLATGMYGKFGTGGKGSMFGLDNHLLEEALSDFLEKKARIPIRAATASANKEVEKQNDMLLRNALAQHNMEKIKLIQAIAQAQAGPADKEVMVAIVKSQDALMRRTFRNFGYDNPEEFVPEWKGGTSEQKPQAPAGTNGMAQPVPQQGQSAPPANGGGMAAVAPGLAEPSNGQR